MQEEERVANEEAEKRLKAALTAKREPGTATSRLASPKIGSSQLSADASTDQKPSLQDTSAADDVTMEADAASLVLSLPSAEVSLVPQRFSR